MTALLLTILFGFLSIQAGYSSYPYIYPEPLLTEFPYFHQYNIPQFYIQPHYFYPSKEVQATEKQIKQNLTSNVNNTEDEKFLGFGYRTEHDGGHSNVVFLQSSASDQLGLSLAEEFGSKAIEGTSSSGAKTIASDMVDSNAEKIDSNQIEVSPQIQFPEGNGDEENVFEFLEKPATSFHTFYTFNTKIFPRETFQPLLFRENLFNNNFVDLFSRFGFSSETRTGKADNSKPQSASLVELNDTKITTSTEMISKDSETTTEVTDETTMNTTEESDMKMNTTST